VAATDAVARPRSVLAADGLRTRAIAVAVFVALSVLYLRWAPLAPDLAAQVLRTEIVRARGASSWWTGWYGGMLLPDYSVLSPLWMAWVGVRLAAVLAVGVTTGAAAVLARGVRRPRATVLAVGLSSFADILDGRVTFAIGIAIGALCLVSIRGRRWPVVPVALAVATYLASPLAGLFLGLIATAIALCDKALRVRATAAALVLVVTAVGAVLYLPGTGTMPFPARSAVPAAVCSVIVLGAARARTVRTVAALSLLAMAVLLVVPGAIGENMTRLAWLLAVPALLACSPWRVRWVALAVAVLTAWPAADLAQQLSAGHTSASRQSYYQPLIRQLASLQRATPELGQRLEVLDTANHWPTVYLSSLSLARGWDRQLDRAVNPIFYQPHLLTPASYHDWLHSLAVGWVAVPRAPLDYAARAEARLVAARPGYLSLVWTNPDWRLYRVTDATSLASGARVVAVDGTGIGLQVARPGPVTLRVHWSPYLLLQQQETQQPVPVCVANQGGFVRLAAVPAGRFELVSHFDPARRLHDPDCAG